MKTAISLPDDLFRRADILAHELGKSRSELYREAVAEYLARRDPEAITAALNALADELEAEDPWRAVIQRRVLERAEW